MKSRLYTKVYPEKSILKVVCDGNPTSVFYTSTDDITEDFTQKDIVYMQASISYESICKMWERHRYILIKDFPDTYLKSGVSHYIVQWIKKKGWEGIEPPVWGE